MVGRVAARATRLMMREENMANGLGIVVGRIAVVGVEVGDV